MASFSVNGAIGQEPAGASLRRNSHGSGRPNHGAKSDRRKKSGAATAPAGRQPVVGNSPVSSLSVTLERPLFSASRRPPAPPAPLAPPPVPVAEAPPPPAEPERPPLTLVGTAIGEPQNVALILNPTTKSFIRLHVGEAATGWYLRSVDSRTMTLEKNNQLVTLSLPAPGATPVSPQPFALAGRISR